MNTSAQNFCHSDLVSLGTMQDTQSSPTCCCNLLGSKVQDQIPYSHNDWCHKFVVELTRALCYISVLIWFHVIGWRNEKMQFLTSFGISNQWCLKVYRTCFLHLVKGVFAALVLPIKQVPTGSYGESLFCWMETGAEKEAQLLATIAIALWQTILSTIN